MSELYVVDDVVASCMACGAYTLTRETLVELSITRRVGG